MICGWEATFTTTGQVHWTVAIDDDHHGHVTFQEAVSYTLVIDDDPEVPASLARRHLARTQRDLVRDEFRSRVGA